MFERILKDEKEGRDTFLFLSYRNFVLTGWSTREHRPYLFRAIGGQKDSRLRSAYCNRGKKYI